ncbi:MAG: XRE family transcriptional regulator [Mesorhizobium sp.]|nr:helix-turn-helix transcriptional regulator [Mesorhizobium sp.]RWK79791.1 MAG: XRE family transcriptional regulator [Mesorhizobium sp.]RWK82568.1 MAG: XRE family transcriptional regulator [Mesorhizobium sp.]RWL08828.1 MAG: XRE family transcriptional regulator [Mesorhizobium sp.]
MLDASQIKAARALIDWSQGDLAEKSGLALATIKRMEKLGPGRSALSNVEAVKAALESAGVIFIDPNGNGAGVRLRGGGSNSEGSFLRGN